MTAASDPAAAVPPDALRSDPTPTAVYVHVPFCSRKCPYCAFACTDDYAHPDVERYLRLLPIEFERRLGTRSLPLRTVYLGGGTPSALGSVGLDRLLTDLRGMADFSTLEEFTVEVNPSHVDPALCEVLRRHGVDRVSLGAQSFDPAQLKRLGRDHRSEDAAKALELLRRHEIKRINLDLMYALPLQSKISFLEDVRRGLDLGCRHFSLYALEFEPSTPFGLGRRKGVLRPTDDGAVADMFHAARELLSSRGVEWYEVSNFSAPGEESLHNRTYWRNEPYLGVGPGAYGRVGATRYRNWDDLARWAAALEDDRDPTGENDALGPREDVLETLVAGLRTREGVAWSSLGDHPPLVTTARRLFDEGYATETARGFALTTEGLLVLDALLPRFLAAVDAP